MKYVPELDITNLGGYDYSERRRTAATRQNWLMQLIRMPSNNYLRIYPSEDLTILMVQEAGDAQFGDKKTACWKHGNVIYVARDGRYDDQRKE